MYRSPTSNRFARTRALTTFALVVAAAALAACNDDAPALPSEPVRPSLDRSEGNGPSKVGGGSGTVIFSVVDGTNNTTLLAGAVFKITGPNNFSLNLTDNWRADEDLTGGMFKVSGLFEGTYTLCEITPPAKYMLPYVPFGPCRTFGIVTNGTTTLSSIKNLHIPIVTWSVTDPVNNLLGYAYFQVRDSTYAVIHSQILDNSALDKNATLGKFQMELPTHGSFYVCETSAPSGYHPPTPNCKWFLAVGGTNPQMVGTFVNNPTYSVYFNAVDSYGKPLGGTKFGIWREYYGNTYVSDNIFPDRDPVTGKYFVVLPAPGWYVVCQTEAPYGYDGPKGTARCSPVSFSPKVGVPANGGTFVSTPWPVPR